MPKPKLGKLKRSKLPVDNAQQPTISALFGESSKAKKESSKRIQHFSAHMNDKEQTDYNVSSEKSKDVESCQLKLPDSTFVVKNENHSSTSSGKNKAVKYTPLEQQVLDLKQKHCGMILMIQTGYKYTFFGEDAEVRYKVGVVNQAETAAMKAESENKNAPFVRELVNIYTKATLIGDDILFFIS
ncbi:hypothetical protein C0J52_01763 [Blattella germanica]|nr:hypothetical protein C0J52_01763 [Blattella germanica]